MIEHKSDVFIVRFPNLLPPSLRRKMKNSTPFLVINQLIHQESGTASLKKLKFKSWTSPPKTIPVVLAIMGRFNFHAVYGGDVEVHPSESTFESIFDSVPYLYTTTIKSIDDYEIYQLL